MIKTVAEFLRKLMEQEAKRLDSYEIKHAPTIGDMYEGLSKDLLGRAIPHELNLQIVSGFITDGAGGLSGQIDCMLVRGSGEQIPYTDTYKWHVRDVIAVFEIKKSLYRSELVDAFKHLLEVRELEHSYMQAARDGGGEYDIRVAERAFAETTGIVAPPHEESKQLELTQFILYHTLLMEQICAVRVVIGYNGYKSEYSFRESLITHMTDSLAEFPDGVQGFGPGSFPQLIISGDYSMCKANGQPFSAKLHEGEWPFYLSSAANPLELLLEFIWTRLNIQYEIGGMWGDDMTRPALHPFLLAWGAERDGRRGWYYRYIKTSEAKLAATNEPVKWTPAYLTATQFAVIAALCAGSDVSLEDSNLASSLEEEGMDAHQFASELARTGLVAIDGNWFELTTERCQAIILPTGEMIAGENNTGRVTRWFERYLEERKADT